MTNSSIDHSDDWTSLSAATLALSLSFPFLTPNDEPVTDPSQNESENDEIDESTNAEQRERVIDSPTARMFEISQFLDRNDPFHFPMPTQTQSKCVTINDANEPIEISNEEWIDGIKQFSSLIDRQALNKTIIEWLNVEGYGDVASAMERDSGITVEHPAELAEDRMKIRASIMSGDIAAAIEQLKSINPNIFDTETFEPLAFVLHLQQLIELIRVNDIPAALEYARCHVVPLAVNDSDLLDELERVMSLIAYNDPLNQSPDADLLSFDRREQCAHYVNAAVLAVNDQSADTHLNHLMEQMFATQELVADQYDCPTVRIVHGDDDSAPSTSIDGTPDPAFSPINIPATQPLASRTLSSDFSLQASSRRASLPLHALDPRSSADQLYSLNPSWDDA